MPSCTQKDFEFGESVGTGRCYQLHLATCISTRATYLIKTYEKKLVAVQNGISDMRAERRILGSLQHSNVAKLYSSFFDRERTYFVLDIGVTSNICTLRQYIEQNKPLSTNVIRSIIRQIIDATEYLHNMNIILRYLVLDDIYIVGNSIKFVHFNTAAFVDKECGEQDERLDIAKIGNKENAAPELIFDEPATKATDFWYIGCIIYELMIGVHPFISKTDKSILNKIVNRELEYPDTVSEVVVDLIDQLLCVDIEHRIHNFTALRAHEFFTADEETMKTSRSNNSSPELKTSRSGLLDERTSPRMTYEGNQVILKGQSFIVYQDSRKVAKYKIERKLGGGAQGSVFVVSEEGSDQLFALKRIVTSSLSDFEHAKLEVTNVAQLEHNGIVNITQVYEHISPSQDVTDQYCLYFLMELYEGDLAKIITEYRAADGCFSQEQLADILYQLSDVLSYIHSNHLIHRDLKPQNIFIRQKNPRLEIVVGDFGLSKRVDVSSAQHSIVGTATTMAPEIYCDKPYGLGVDLFSLGCTMFTLMTLELNKTIAWDLLNSADPKQVIKQLGESLYAKKRYDNDFIELVLKMLDRDPKERPQAEDVKGFCIRMHKQYQEHPFTYRVGVVGSLGVGKDKFVTCLSRQPYYDVVTDCISVKVDGCPGSIELIFDQEKYFDIKHDLLIRMLDACFVMFSMTDAGSFKEAKELCSQVKELHSGKKFPIVLIANKMDLVNAREVSEEEANTLATDLNCPMLFISAVEHVSKKVDSCIYEMIREARKLYPPRQNNNGRCESVIKHVPFLKDLRLNTGSLIPHLNHKTRGESPFSPHTDELSVFLRQGEKIAFFSPILKRRRLSRKKRLLILTNAPRLFYIKSDPCALEYKGEVSLSAVTDLVKKSEHHMVIRTHKRDYCIQVQNSTTEEWERAISMALRCTN